MGKRKVSFKVLHYLVMAVLLSVAFFAAIAAYGFVQKKFEIAGLSWVAAAVVWSLLSFFISVIDSVYNEEENVPAIFYGLLEAVQLIFISTVILYFFKYNIKIGFGLFIVYNLGRMLLSRHPLFDSSSRVVSVNRRQLLEGKKEEGLWVTDSLLDLEAMHREKKEVKDLNVPIQSKDYISAPAPVKKLSLDDSGIPGVIKRAEESMPVSGSEDISKKEDKVFLKVPLFKAPKSDAAEPELLCDLTDNVTGEAKEPETKESTIKPEIIEAEETIKVPAKKTKPVAFKQSGKNPFQELIKKRPAKEIRAPELPPETVLETDINTVPDSPPEQILPVEPVKLQQGQSEDRTLIMKSDEVYEIPVDLTGSGVEHIEEPLGPKIFSIMDSDDSINKLFLTVRRDMSRLFNIKSKLPVELVVEFPDKGKQEEGKRKLTGRKKENDKWILNVTGSLTEDVTYGLLAANMADIWFEENAHSKVQDYRKGFSFWMAYKLLKSRGYENAAYQSTKQDMINFRKVRTIEKDFGEYGVLYYILNKENPETMPDMFMKDTIPHEILMELGKGEEKTADEASHAAPLALGKPGFPFRETSTSKPSIKLPKKEKEKPEVIELDLAMTRFLRQEKPDHRKKPEKIISLETGDIVELDKKE